MKKLYLFIAGLLALSALFLAGCFPAVGDLFTHMGDDEAAEIELFGESDDLRDDEVGSAGALSVSAISPASFPLYNTSGQLFSIDFDYMVDAATAASAIKFWTIADNTATDYDTLSTLNAITASAPTVVAQGVGCRAYFTLDLSSSWSRSLVHIDAATLAAAGGAAKLDGDGDGTLGEAGVDDYRYTFTVYQNSASGSTAPTATVSELVANPRVKVFYSPSTTLAGGFFDYEDFGDTDDDDLTFESRDTGNPEAPALRNRLTIDADCAAVYKMVNGAWTQISSTTTYDAPNYLATISLSPAPAPGEAYKVVVDKHKIYESGSGVRGSVHRATYDQLDATGDRYDVNYVFFDRGYGSYQDINGTVFGGDNAKYIDVIIDEPDAVPFNMGTITPETFKVGLTGTTLGPDGAVAVSGTYFADYSIQPLYTASFDVIDTAVYSFRIYLSHEVHDFAGGSLYVSPSVISMDVATPVSGAGIGKRHFASRTASVDGWIKDTLVF